MPARAAMTTVVRHLSLRLLLALFLGLLAWGGAQAFWAQPRGHDLATAHLAGLPAEARQTLELIKRGGPFPYPRDGIVFQNREGRLPIQARGYYREYTVATPGRRDRGARRIVAGRPGEYYYSQDHYRSFWRIKE
jgi:ribonuclease T1